VILTKMDGDARGGAALSIYGVTKKPIKYIGVGEKPDALEEFHPDRLAGRILQMGDVVSLVEKAQQSLDEEEARKLDKKVRKQGMDLQDFLSAMKQMDRMGPIEGMLKLLAGRERENDLAGEAGPEAHEAREAIVLSMTPEERKNPGIINGSRRARIAKGSGRAVSDVNRLLDQFREMQKMMKKMGAGSGRRFSPQMFGTR
jgi:signal recognition particle subunit SRP54